ncbi:EP300-interacting inhibitor of differentiation 3 [Papilio machaon]|uniref:EP300-interacting inhibitor of differentiation 3 n=1 Tax=Papilio machaon TaxID=76193 RepID=UPI001E665173|nr:EP300-interacting inhibitor of differentiation 3 [Papilio machaon]
MVLRVKMSSMNCSDLSRTSSYERKLRYRELLEDLSTIEDDADNVRQMERTAEVVSEAHNLLATGGIEERAKHPGENYLDSRVLCASSDHALRCSEAVSGNMNTYDKHQLAQHIRENPEFWEFTFPREVPVVASLFGTFAPTPAEQRPRAPRRRVERQQAAAVKAPETVDKLDRTEEGSEMVGRAQRFVSKACRAAPLCYWRAVLDPHSFARTIENIYYISFLARDGIISIDIDEESGLPFIKTVSSGDRERGAGSANQFIVSIDMHTWKELVDAFRIERPMMVLKGR